MTEPAHQYELKDGDLVPACTHWNCTLTERGFRCHECMEVVLVMGVKPKPR